MKKVLLVLAIGAFAACGSGSTETTTGDSSSMSTDSGAMVAPAMPDTASSMSADTSMKMGGDTSMKMKDTATKM